MPNDSLSVFISCTRRDLEAYIAAAKEAVERYGARAVVMERKTASFADALTVSLKWVDEAEIYLGIFANRYGYCPDDPDCGGETRSITELEYRRAVELGKPRLIFILDEKYTPPKDAPLSLHAEKKDSAAWDKLTALKEDLRAEQVVAFFTTPDNLGMLVYQALVDELGAPKRGYQPAPPPPKGELPPRAPLPPGSRMLLGENPNFVGREPDMLALAERLLYANGDGGNAVITPAAAATGVGGIGKTQLAVEFAHRYGRFFYGVHWLNFADVREPQATQARLRAEIAACGAQMGLPNFPDKLPEQVAVTREAWRRTPQRLLILDNMESPHVYDAVRTELAGLRVLLTSRWGETQDWRNLGLSAHHLETLTRAQSLELLRKLAPHLCDVPDEELNALAERLGDFPLALDIAGRYLHTQRRGGLTVPQYVEKLKLNPLEHRSMKAWADKATSPTRHDLDVAATFALSWEQVRDPLAERIFRAAGYLAPNQPIPPELLQRLAGDGDSSLNALLQLLDDVPSSIQKDMLRDLLGEDATDPEALGDALQALVNYGLLTPTEDDPRLRIHPLLADFARSLDAEAAESALPPLTKALARLSYEANDTGLPANFYPLRPHVETVADWAEKAELEDAGALWSNLGYHLDMVADFSEAKAAHERALRVAEKVHGPEHPTVAIVYINLGKVLYAMGDLAGAREHHERALPILERVLGSEHPTVAIVYSNLGEVFHAMGNFSEAREHYERALRIKLAVLPADHPDIALSLNNLGGVLRVMGDFSGAREHFERALRIFERLLGSEHPNVATSLNNLGGVLQDMRDFAGAWEHYERALHIRQAILPPDHPDIANSLNNLGSVLREMGNLVSAWKHHERALRIQQATLPPDHLDIAISLGNLAYVLHDLGEKEAACEHWRWALGIFQAKLPAHHPYVQATRRELIEHCGESGIRVDVVKLLEAYHANGEDGVRQFLQGQNVPSEVIEQVIRDLPQLIAQLKGGAEA